MEKYVGLRMRKARKEKKLSLAKVGEMIGYDFSNLSKAERGEIEPTISLLEKLSVLYDVPVGFFFGDEVEIPEELQELDIEEIRIAKEIRSEKFTEEEIKLVKDFVNMIKMRKKV